MRLQEACCGFGSQDVAEGGVCRKKIFKVILFCPNHGVSEPLYFGFLLLGASLYLSNPARVAMII